MSSSSVDASCSLTTSFIHLPGTVLSAILYGFCSGKAISTFLVVARSSNEFRENAFTLCRGTLVRRFTDLADHFLGQSEIKDILDKVLDDLLLSIKQEKSNNDNKLMTRFSELCAILDYFELHTQFGKAHPNLPTQWVIWSGRSEIPCGAIDACLVTPQWTVRAMMFWCHGEHVATWTSQHHDSLQFIRLPHYGNFLGLNSEDRSRLESQSRGLGTTVIDDTGRAVQLEPGRTLIPLVEAQLERPSMALASHYTSMQLSPTRSLACYWDVPLDWNRQVDDDSAKFAEETKDSSFLSRLSGQLIDIMDSFGVGDHRSMRACLEEAYNILRNQPGGAYFQVE